MRATKNDLSYDLAEIDYQALLITAQYAVGELTEKCADHIDKIRRTAFTKDGTSLRLNASNLKQAAIGLEICADTLATLEGVLENRRIEDVNLPERKEDPLASY